MTAPIRSMPEARMPTTSMVCVCGCKHEIGAHGADSDFVREGWLRCFCGARWDIKVSNTITITQRVLKPRKKQC